MKKIFTALLLLPTVFFARTQDVTGIWRGHFWNSNLHSKNSVQQPFQGDDRYKVEVQIAQQGDAFKAVTYSYLNTIFYAKAGADGTVNPRTQKVLLRELKLLEVRTIGGDVYAMTYFLHYSKLGDAEYLEGTFTSLDMRDSSRGSGGVVFLHKVPMSEFHTEPFVEKREEEIAKNKDLKDKPELKKENPAPLSKTPPVRTRPSTVKQNNSNNKPVAVAKNKPRPPIVKRPAHHNPSSTQLATEPVNPVKLDSVRPDHKFISPAIIPKVLSSRQNQLVRTIAVSTNEIELDIYDDGTIDNDTVSVFLDKKMVIAHAMLTDRPLIMKVHLDEDNNYHEVVMVADNEGTIPPNTSLMVVKAGDKRYEVRIISTEQKNATVIFKYEKPK